MANAAAGSTPARAAIQHATGAAWRADPRAATPARASNASISSTVGALVPIAAPKRASHAGTDGSKLLRGSVVTAER